MDNGTIYMIKNDINNKVYIGQTTKSLYNRKRDHLSRLRNGKHFNSHLQNSFNKYKESSFCFSVLHKCNISDLDKFEILYINLYNSLKESIGYNKDSGGTKNKIISESTRIKLSVAGKGRKKTEVHSLKISKSLKNRYECGIEHHRNGTSHTESTKKKMSIKSIGIPKSESHKKSLRKPKSEQWKRKMFLLKTSTGEKGICFDKNRSKYMAIIFFNNKNKYIGRYNSIDEAKNAYDNFKIKNNII